LQPTQIIATKKCAESLSEACAHAQRFEECLRSNKELPSALLAGLVDSREWDSWESVLSQEGSRFKEMARFRLSLFGGETRSLADDLKRIATNVLLYLTNFLVHATTKLSIVPWSRCTEDSIAGLLLGSHTPELLFYFEFLRVSDTGSSLVTKMVGSSRGLSRDLRNVHNSVAIAFKRLSLSHESLLQRKNIEAIGKTLGLMKTSAVWSTARAFANTPWNPVSAYSADESWKLLRESIAGCKDYEALCKDTVEMLHVMKLALSEFSFEQIINAVNEYDRNKFYSNIVDALLAMATVSCLLDHVSAQELKFVEDLEDTIDRIIRETQEIGGSVKTLLSTFPGREEDFPLLNTSVANLQSIATAFREKNDKVVAVAESLRSEAERDLSGQLRNVLGLAASSADALLPQLILLKRQALRSAAGEF
jgi:hypothetical protein